MKKSERHLTIRGAGKHLKLIFTAAFFVGIGMGIYTATFNNFAHDYVHMSDSHFCYLEAFRESPGFAMALMVALAMHIAEPVLSSGAIFLMALGFIGYSGTRTYVPLVAFSVLWSIGLHCWMAMQPAMTLALSEDGHKARRLGQGAACGGLGTAIGMGGVMLLGARVPYPTWYIVTAGAMFVSSIVVRYIRRDLSPPDKPRLVFKRRYFPYYALTFLEGCRKQVFITFAPWVLVRVYNVDVKMIAFLMLFNCGVSMFGSPIIGKMIDRRGEALVMSISYSMLILVFLGYAFAKLLPAPFIVPALSILYCCDNLLYLSTIGLTSYINRIAKDGDLVPSITMGISTNHLGAVAIPIIGGLLWSAGYSKVFVVGACVVTVSLILALRMRKQLTT